MNFDELKNNIINRIKKEVIDTKVFKNRLLKAYDKIDERVTKLQSSLKIDIEKPNYEKDLKKFQKDSKEITAEETSYAFLEVLTENLLKILVDEYKKAK